MTHRFQAVKGTRDILPPESALWNRVEQTARRVFATYNFQEIRLPLFEETELFARSVGADTDIVAKEMYTFVDRPAELVAPRNIKEIGFYAHAAEQMLKASEIPNNESNREAIQGIREALVKAQERRLKLAAKGHANPEEIDAYANGFLVALYYAQSAQLGQKVTLRPEATASVVRAYIQHGLHTRPGLTKLYYIGPMFRRERPQKGRYRQFYQIGAEVLGSSDHPALDAEIIEMLLVFLDRCGLREYTLYVNSIGCSDCRPKYIERLRGELQKVKDQLGADSRRRIETNPLRVLDSKLPEEQLIIEKLPSILDHLCDACREHFQKFQQELKDRSLAYEINKRLVRGLDYYIRTTFEVTAPGLGAQNAICGGGRYDGLVELLGGPPTKGMGFALGTDRLLLALRQVEESGGKVRLDVFMVWLGASALRAARTLARRLREQGISTELLYEETKLKKALGLADKSSARYAVLIGEDELAQNKFTLRDMRSGQQRAMSESELLQELAVSAGASAAEE